MSTAFVTGATGLLGSNLVRLLLKQGYQVKALARSREKAHRQFASEKEISALTVIEGDMAQIDQFAAALQGCDVVFHTAAYFRESYRGGRHWAELQAINVDGTRQLIEAAYQAGVRKFIHTSSIAVLDGPRGGLIDETMIRDEADADDYYRSKILSDRAVAEALDRYPDLFACFILPGWMHGPGDLGPTSAGQFTLDYLHGRLPGVPPGTFAFVDARDVAHALIIAAEKGRRGERYLAAGRHVAMRDLMQCYAQVTGIAAPKRAIPPAVLWIVAGFQELSARLMGKSALMGLATVRLMLREADRTRFDHRKSEHDLGLSFRPIHETVADEVTWLRNAERA